MTISGRFRSVSTHLRVNGRTNPEPILSGFVRCPDQSPLVETQPWETSADFYRMLTAIPLIKRVICSLESLFHPVSTVESPCPPSSLWTPVYNVQFRLSRRKADILSLKLTSSIRITNTFLCSETQTSIYRQPRSAGTGYSCALYFPCHSHVLI